MDGKKTTQRQLGELLMGKPDGNTVSRWERGDYLPEADTWAELIEVLGLDRDTAWRIWGEAQTSSVKGEVAKARSEAERVAEPRPSRGGARRPKNPAAGGSPSR